MGIIVDIIVIAIIALSVYLGYRKGLIALAIQLCAVIIALVATLILYKPISALIIDNTSLDENIQNAILEKAENNDENNTQENNNENNQVANAENINVTEENSITSIMPEVAKELSINIINIGVMLILYFAIKIALHFVTALANLVAKIPIIKQINKLGGIIYGLLRGILLIYVVLLLISFAGQINPENALHKEIKQSFITKEMYEHNIINIFIE